MQYGESIYTQDDPEAALSGNWIQHLEAGVGSIGICQGGATLFGHSWPGNSIKTYFAIAGVG